MKCQVYSIYWCSTHVPFSDFEPDWPNIHVKTESIKVVDEGLEYTLHLSLNYRDHKGRVAESGLSHRS